MESPATTRRIYRFGLFELNPASGELLRQGVRVRLQDQPFRLLTILLEHAGDVVPHDELRRKLWPADTFVEFDGSLKAALKRLRGALGDSADNPIFIETIPKRGYRFVAPVTSQAGDSPAPVSLRTQHLGGESVPAPAQTQPSPAPLTTRRGFLVYATVACLVVLVLLAWFDVRHPSSSPSKSSGVVQAAIPVRKSVAVLGFHNASPRQEDDWLDTAFSEMLSTELGAGEKLRLVSGEEVANLRITAPWPQVGTLGQKTATRLGSTLNSDVLVLGSYAVVGSTDRGQVRLDVDLQDGRTGTVIAQIAQTGNRNDLFRLTSEIGAKLRDKLGIPAVTDAEEPALIASMPADSEAARFYSRGIAELRDFDARAAKDLLLQAVAADPKFPLAHSALANAWSQLGYEQKRKEEAKKAMDLSGNLPQIEKLQVEGDYYESVPDHEKAASAYSALFELFPDNIDDGLQLAYAQNAANHKTEALETVARLRRLPATASDDPRIDLAEAHMLPSERSRDSFALLHAAEAKANAQGKKIIYARVRREECMDLVYGEHPDQADAPCEDAYNMYQAAGNNLGAADALRLMADQQGAEGHTVEARAAYERALRILVGQGEHLKTATILNNMANGYTNEGDLARGEQLYRQAKAHFEQGGDPRNAAVALVNIADILYLRGELMAAAATYQQVIDDQETVEGGSPGYGLYRLADLELTRGRVQDAHRLVTQAIEALHGIKSSNLGDSVSELGDVLATEGDLQGARQQYQRGLEIRQELDRPGDVAESEESLAEVDLDERHPDHAEAVLHTAIAQFEKEKLDPSATSAYTLLSHALLLEGKLDDSRKAIQHAADLDRNNVDPNLKLPIEIQTARVDLAAAGTKPSARAVAPAEARLRSAIASAHKLGYYKLECEARLELAQAESATDPVSARSHLAALEKETRDHGLLLLASQAHNLQSAPKPAPPQS